MIEEPHTHPVPPTRHYLETHPAVRRLADEIINVISPNELYEILSRALHAYVAGPEPTCYVAGPMRGYPNFNFEAFLAAEEALKAKGWKVWNPARIDMEQDGFKPWGQEGVEGEIELPMEHYIRRDIGLICSLRQGTKDAIVLLPGWEESTGASAEWQVGKWAKVPRISLDWALDGYLEGSTTP